MFLANFLIALREGVEASLIVGILATSLVKMGRRDVLPRLWLGVGLAALVPLAVGALMTWGPYTLTFQAQEILGGVLSLVAAVMLTWMILWMGQHSREMSADLRTQTAAALARSSGWGIVWLAALSVGREGLETAVFVWATVRATASGGLWQPTAGVVAGLAVAVVIGWLIYRGTARINVGKFFSLTSYLLVVVAAGIVAYGLGDLQEAGVIPGWGTSAYDLSGYFDGHIPGVHPGAWWFVLAEAMFNVNLAPTVVQVVGWCAYLIAVLPLLWRQQRGLRGGAPRARRADRAHSAIGADSAAHADGAARAAAGVEKSPGRASEESAPAAPSVK